MEDNFGDLVPFFGKDDGSNEESEIVENGPVGAVEEEFVEVVGTLFPAFAGEVSGDFFEVRSRVFYDQILEFLLGFKGLYGFSFLTRKGQVFGLDQFGIIRRELIDRECC